MPDIGLQGFTKLLGAPGSDGVYRYQPSPADPEPTKAQDDSAEVADWFTTQPDPAVARAVATAEAEARKSVSALDPGLGARHGLPMQPQGGPGAVDGPKV